MEIRCVYLRSPLPPYGAHFRYLVSSWRSWVLSWLLILMLSGPILSPSCSKMAPRWPNIAQHSAKMSQHSLQEQPQDPKKPSKVLYSRRFFGFRHFWQDRAQDPKQVAKMLPKVRQVGHLNLQVGHLGHILAPSWPTWRHLGPSWRQDAPQQAFKWSPTSIHLHFYTSLHLYNSKKSFPLCGQPSVSPLNTDYLSIYLYPLAHLHI